MRWALSLLLVLVSAAPARAAAVPLGDGGALALAASRSIVYAALDSGDREAPFELVRSSGRGASDMGSFGTPGAEYPSLAVGENGLWAAWGRLGSAGFAYSVAASDSLSEPEDFGVGTGPPRLAAAGQRRVITFPDRSGDVALAEAIPRAAPQFLTLTDSAPEQRHLPLATAAGEENRVYVLDLVQTRTRSELRLLGLDAPAAAIVAVDALRGLSGSVAIDGGRAYVAYFARGHAVLATAPLSPGGTWTRRVLPGPGLGTGNPAIARAGGRTLVAYMQRVRRNSEVYAWVGGRLRRLSADPAADTDPLAAATQDGDLFVAWTRTPLHGAGATALLAQVD